MKHIKLKLLVNLLNKLFNGFKGDAYMIASGVPAIMKKDHVREIASIALMQREVFFKNLLNSFLKTNCQKLSFSNFKCLLFLRHYIFQKNCKCI